MQFQCPHCRKRSTGPDNLAGQPVTCPHCRKPFKAHPLAISVPAPAQPVMPTITNYRKSRRKKRAIENLPIGAIVGGGVAVLLGLVVLGVYLFASSSEGATSQELGGTVRDAGMIAGGIVSMLFTLLLLAVALIIGTIVYFLPTAVAWATKNHNLAAIAVLNILLGWSFVGWVVALVWAFAKPSPPARP